MAGSSKFYIRFTFQSKSCLPCANKQLLGDYVSQHFCSRSLLISILGFIPCMYLRFGNRHRPRHVSTHSLTGCEGPATLRNLTKVEEYNVTLQNRFEGLDSEVDLESMWDNFKETINNVSLEDCLLYTSPSPRDAHESRMPSSA